MKNIEHLHNLFGKVFLNKPKADHSCTYRMIELKGFSVWCGLDSRNTSINAVELLQEVKDRLNRLLSLLIKEVHLRCIIGKQPVNALDNMLLALLDTFVSELFDAHLKVFKNLSCSQPVIFLADVFDRHYDIAHARLVLRINGGLGSLCLKEELRSLVSCCGAWLWG
jgi:hypothetical protein